MTTRLDAKLRGALRAHVRGEICFDEPLSHHTSWHVGGPADALVFPSDEDDLCAAMRFAKAHALPVFVVGGGSNLLVRDGGIRGLTLSLSKGLRAISSDPAHRHVVAEGGCRIGRLLTYCALRGLCGLEFLADIPGTVGGVARMNAGAMGGEFKDVVLSVDLVLEDGSRRTLAASELAFVYRSTALPAGSVVARCALRVGSGDPRLVQEHISAIRKQRRAVQPTGATAGSTFKNPPGDYAGRLIESAGLKGARVGAAEVSRRHANFLLNLGGASAADVLALIEQIREEVRAKFNVELELEVKVVGEPLGGP